MSAAPVPPADATGIVVIGRNEGERLRACLRSLAPAAAAGCALVYVDSGSGDGSVAWARAAGVDVVELAPEDGYTMARGRNAGLHHLARQRPHCRYVQFLDGDCELVAGWLSLAVEALERDAGVAVVFGRRREGGAGPRLYRRLLDLEWAAAPVGEAPSFGGDALGRIEALLAAGGFDPELIAGEEPELSLRLRRQGWRILGLDAEMSRHNGTIETFGQCWRRAMRYGWAVAAAVARHGAGAERFGVRSWLSGWFWGLALPLAGVALLLTHPPAALVVPLLYLALGAKIYLGSRGRGMSPPDARLYALYCVLSKLPQALGQLRYLADRLAGRRTRLIEYKPVRAAGDASEHPHRRRP
jgi:GT2 family glycosyltransferase